MSAGERHRPTLDCAGAIGRRLALRAWCASAAVLAWPAWAIDNPDAPDHSAAFLARARPHEDRLSEAAGGPGAARAGAAYAEFLDAELNQAYRQLQQRLDAPARRALARSQRQWLLFRDAESQFIGLHWTPQAYGSSSALSRADYRATLVRQRVLTLLAYLQNDATPVR